tara:strand:- start:552 stop:1025 length:474 start_codon:yes stop_codon:yes gene_type:complete
MQIIDNFLEPEKFTVIQQTLMSDTFPWFYRPGSAYTKDGVSQLVHLFYDFLSNSSYIGLLDPVLKKLNVLALVRIKANLTYPNKKAGSVHTDYTYKNLKTAIYYLNTNDGGTKIKGKPVKSIANRMVIFPSSTPHTIMRHTNPNIGRFVINFNYYEC